MTTSVSLLLLGFIGITSGGFCSKRYTNGKWVSHGDCGHIPDHKSIIKDLRAQKTCESLEGFYSHEKCYIAKDLFPDSADFHKSNSECVKQGAMLAEIYDRAQQIALNDLIFQKVNALKSPSRQRGYVFWTGMEYLGGSTMKLRFRSNTLVDPSNFHWVDNFPDTSPNNHVSLQVNVTATSASTGFRNEAPAEVHHGFLCAKEI